jgi:hypothetical protein
MGRFTLDIRDRILGAIGDVFLLLILFAGSGCAALIYEVVWFQLLQLVIGASAISLGLLLSAYMGGLCLGSALLPRMMPAKPHPVRFYAFCEAGIAAFGIFVLSIVPFVSRLDVAGAEPGVWGIFRAARSLHCASFPQQSSWAPRCRRFRAVWNRQKMEWRAWVFSIPRTLLEQ